MFYVSHNAILVVTKLVLHDWSFLVFIDHLPNFHSKFDRRKGLNVDECWRSLSAIENDLWAPSLPRLQCVPFNWIRCWCPFSGGISQSMKQIAQFGHECYQNGNVVIGTPASGRSQAAQPSAQLVSWGGGRARLERSRHCFSGEADEFRTRWRASSCAGGCTAGHRHEGERCDVLTLSCRGFEGMFVLTNRVVLCSNEWGWGRGGNGERWMMRKIRKQEVSSGLMISGFGGTIFCFWVKMFSYY